MSSRLDALAGRRSALAARSDHERAAFAAAFGDLERRLAVADVIVSTARRVSRHRVLAGAAAAVMILAPLAARTWIRRAVWVLPLIIEGVRIARALGDARRPSRTE